MTTVASNRNIYFKKFSINVDAFPDEEHCKFGFQATKVIISVTKGSLEFSFQKPEIDGELFCSDGPIVFDGIGAGKLWFRRPASPATPVEIRVWAWRI